MWDITSHDYAHCNQIECSKKEDCFRYRLYLEDLKSKEETYCSYLIISPEQSKVCKYFINDKQV